MVDGVFTEALSMRDELADCFHRYDADAPTTRDVAAVQPRLVTALRNGGGLIRGAGVVLAPGLLMDAGLWIDWWALDDTGAIGPAVFDFDEDSLDFYDYTCADWYLAPRDGTRRSLVGPYVDFNGTQRLHRHRDSPGYGRRPVCRGGRRRPVRRRTRTPPQHSQQARSRGTRRSQRIGPNRGVDLGPTRCRITVAPRPGNRKPCGWRGFVVDRRFRWLTWIPDRRGRQPGRIRDGPALATALAAGGARW